MTITRQTSKFAFESSYFFAAIISLRYQDVIAALQVKRATMSALMYSPLEQDGLLRSEGDQNDLRRMLAAITEKGDRVITSAMDLDANRLKEALSHVSPVEFTTLIAILMRVRDGFLGGPAPEGPV